MEEEQGAEGGLLEEVVEGEGDKHAKAVKARLKEIGNEAEFEDERSALDNDGAVLEKQSEAKSASSRPKPIGSQRDAKYPKLTEAEIKTLVVDDKWLAALDAAIHGEMDRISQALTQRVKELAERYETPLPQMISRVADLETG